MQPHDWIAWDAGHYLQASTHFSLRSTIYLTMNFFGLHVVFFITLAVSCAVAFPNRAGSCLIENFQTMTTSPHGKPDPTLGYRMNITQTKYKIGDVLTVSILNAKKDAKFKGILMYAFSANTKNAVGSWANLPRGYQTLDKECTSSPPKSVLSHLDAKDKKVPLQFNWTINENMGDLIFQAVVLQSKSKWMQLSPVAIQSSLSQNVPRGPSFEGSLLPESSASTASCLKSSLYHLLTGFVFPLIFVSV